MSVRDAVEARLAALEAQPEDAIRVTLASRLKPDGSVRLSMMKRLSSTMRFSYGAKAGALKTAAKRSGSAFRVDVRQRVIVKALVSRHMGKGAARGAALAAHVRYLGREGAGHEGEAGNLLLWQAGPSPDRTFPDYPHAPAVIGEAGDRAGVVGAVAFDLVRPEFRSGRRQTVKVAVMAMPETPVDEQHGPPPWEHQVGCPRQTPVMQSKAEATPVKPPTQDHLGFRIPAPDTRHHPAPGGRIDDVRQRRARAPSRPRAPPEDAAPCAGRWPR